MRLRSRPRQLSNSRIGAAIPEPQLRHSVGATRSPKEHTPCKLVLSISPNTHTVHCAAHTTQLSCPPHRITYTHVRFTYGADDGVCQLSLPIHNRRQSYLTQCARTETGDTHTHRTALRASVPEWKTVSHWQVWKLPCIRFTCLASLSVSCVVR